MAHPATTTNIRTPQMKTRNTLRALAILLALTISALPAFATFGYFSHGYGTQHKAMGGVGAALPMNSISSATNPAGLAFLGNRFDLAVGLFSPDRNFTVTGNPTGYPGTFGLTPGKVESGSTSFFVPALGLNRKFGENVALGLAIFGNGGMNTDYDEAVYHATKPTGVNLSQLFVGATYAHRIAEKHSIGIMPIFAYQMFSAEGLASFGNFSTDATKLTDNDTDTGSGFGARIGYMGRFIPKVAIGASYQTRIGMSEFEDYAGLFAEQGDFDIPSTWTAGIAVEATPKLTLAADVEQIIYSEVASVSNPFNPADFQQGILLGSDKGAGFGWDDVTAFKLGAEWRGVEKWAFRLGFATCGQPIPDSEMMFNILAPGVVEQHVTAGFSHYFPGNKELSFSLMHALNNNIEGANPMEAPGAQTIQLEMQEWEFELGFGF
jgi:long-chain fatty acid transport protein